MAIVLSFQRGKKEEQKEKYVYVRFGHAPTNGAHSNLLRGAFGANSAYALTFDLSISYPDAVNDEGNWSAGAAYKRFKDELHVGDNIPEIGCYDVPVSDISDYVAIQLPPNADGERHVLRTFRIACVGGKDVAERMAKSGMMSQLKKGKITAFSSEDEIPTNAVVEGKKSDDD